MGEYIVLGVHYQHKEKIMHGHDRHNRTVLSVKHKMSTTCFGQYYFLPSGWIQLSEKTTQYIYIYIYIYYDTV